MNRRTFQLELSTLIGGSLVLSFASCKTAEGSKIDVSTYDIAEVGIPTLRELIDERQISIKDLTQLYLDRIQAIDVDGPGLNSIIHVNANALKRAEQLDKELNSNSGSPLYGIPVILKDNIDTADMPTTAGSRALDGSYPLQDAHITKLLREAGAVIIAKANLSEWANFRGENSTSGWSGLGGLTKNPYKLDRNTCGSSAGSGAAAAASLCAVAIGTETNGSIVCPSSTNGLVGIKPTVGLVSRSGVIPISSTQDTTGPMARTVEDATLCLGVIAGKDSQDAASQDIPKVIKDYSVYLKKDGLQGKKIAYYNIESNYTESDRKGEVDPIFSLIHAAMDDMKSQGAEFIEIDNISAPHVFSDSFEIMLYEYKEGLNAYFDSLGDKAPVKTIDELIEWNRQDSVELKYFGQEHLEAAAAKGGLSDTAYVNARQRMLEGRRQLGIDRVMDEHGLDAIIGPTNGPAWKTDLINGDTFLIGVSSPAAQSGYPSITVPMGFVDDLPVGMSIFGRGWSEGVLIEIAYAYEQATLHRKAPQYLP